MVVSYIYLSYKFNCLVLIALKKKPVDGFSVEADSSDIRKWTITIQGPADTAFEGGIFKCQMDFPTDYPFSPPTMKFVSE